MPEELAHQNFYSHAELYDLAFSYRNIDQETQFLLSCYQQATGQAAQRVLELACGPARHALACANQGLQASALDCSTDMLAYAQTLAAERGLNLETLLADMRDFQLSAPVDLAFTLLDSTAYLLTQADFLDHLKAVAQNLNSEGLYILEMSHPADVLGHNQRVSTEWEMERDGLRVEMSWSHPNDFFDPVSQITDCSVHLKAWGPGGKRTQLKSQSPQRCYTYQEVLALLALQSDFMLWQSYGAFDPSFALSDERAWRMILALKKISKE